MIWKYNDDIPSQGDPTGFPQSDRIHKSMVPVLPGDQNTMQRWLHYARNVNENRMQGIICNQKTHTGNCQIGLTILYIILLENIWELCSDITREGALS